MLGSTTVAPMSASLPVFRPAADEPTVIGCLSSGPKARSLTRLQPTFAERGGAAN
jgi:hypothetical protein